MPDASRCGWRRPRGWWRRSFRMPPGSPIPGGPMPNTTLSRDGPRVNEDIRVPKVRLIDQDGEMQGVMTARDALLRAYAVGLDLLEISPNADPPVCKILDYGKYKYELQ